MNQRFDGVFNIVLIGGLVVFMAFWGIATIAGGSADRKLGDAPEVKLSELAAHAGKTVRVRARVAADPPLRDLRAGGRVGDPAGRRRTRVLQRPGAAPGPAERRGGGLSVVPAPSVEAPAGGK